MRLTTNTRIRVAGTTYPAGLQVTAIRYDKDRDKILVVISGKGRVWVARSKLMRG